MEVWSSAQIVTWHVLKVYLEGFAHFSISNRTLDSPPSHLRVSTCPLHPAFHLSRHPSNAFRFLSHAAFQSGACRLIIYYLRLLPHSLTHSLSLYLLPAPTSSDLNTFPPSARYRARHLNFKSAGSTWRVPRFAGRGPPKKINESPKANG